MYDSLAAKAARFQMAHEPDCGECENCLEVERLKRQYDYARVDSSCEIRKGGNGVWIRAVHNARHAWLEASRIKRCTGKPNPLG